MGVGGSGPGPNLHLHGKAAAVHVFGLRAGDVDAFLRFAAAPGAVDVLVLDQNLEYPQATACVSVAFPGGTPTGSQA